jgi:signal transduction histidine kinase
MTLASRQRKELNRLRVRLTAWYVGTYSAVFAVLAVALFYAITRQINAEFDLLLRETVDGTLRASHIRAAAGATPRDALKAAVFEMETPDRPVYLFDDGGRSLGPDEGTAELRELARRVAGRGAIDTTTTSLTRHWRVVGQRIELPGGVNSVLLAAAATDPVERQYRHLLEAFAGAGVLAILMIGAGGYQLTRLSVRPVMQSMEQMQRFVADAAHELRTPISLIRAQSEIILRHERRPSDYVASLGAIGREAERLGNIANDLLMLAQADAGVRTLARERFYLDDVAADAVAAAEPLAVAQGLTLELGKYEEVAVVGDLELIRRLIVILIDNAIQYTPAGGRVTVDAFPEDRRAVLRVQDTGPGIDPAVLPHVFDRFYRADSMRGRPSGAGLGLAIARWIADAHSAELALAAPSAGGTVAELRMARAL